MNEGHVRQALKKFKHIERLPCGFYPTPIEELPRLRDALGKACARIWIKRDDYTGAGFGGNKVRKLEYVLAKAIHDGAHSAITIGGEKSNHARVTAALCAKFGLHCILVLSPAAVKYEGLEPANLIVDELVGAEVHRVANREERLTTMRAIAERLEGEGKRVAEIPLGASVPLGALGFVRALEEITQQMQAINLRPNYIFHASSSGGTQAGISAGCQLFGMDGTKLIGVSPDDSSVSIEAEVRKIIRGINELLDLPDKTLQEQVTVLDDYVGEGYGIPSEGSTAALNLVARSEGILLDPVYTAKAMAGLIDWIKSDRLTKDDTILFWHTGGQLALFYAPVQ
jgi:D-cysteine desulfhydrase family pyridoxal phosphate-dependent enzyme